MKYFTNFTFSRRQSWLIIALTLASAVTIFAIRSPESISSGTLSGLPNEYQSAQVEEIEKKYSTVTAIPAVGVFNREDNKPLENSDKDAIEKTRQELIKQSPEKVLPVDYAPDGTVALLPVLIDINKGDDESIRQVEDVRKTVKAVGSSLSVNVTGGPAYISDLTKVFEGADSNLLLITVAVVAILLIVTYRSPVLWLIPVLVVGSAEQITAKLVTVLLPLAGITANEAAAGITSILVFGAGTDYALLLIARYKDQLHLTESKYEAMREAWKRTAEAILASGATVILSLLALLFASIEFTRAIGLSAAVGILVAVLSAMFLLPAVLVLFGRKIFWPYVPRRDNVKQDARSIWSRIGQWVERRPRLVLAVGSIFLIILSFGISGVNVGLDQSEQFRVKPEAAIGQEILAKAFPSGLTEPVSVLVSPDTKAEAITKIKQINNVASVQEAGRLGDYELISASLSVAPLSDASYQSIKDIRGTLATIEGSNGLVGGTVARNYDLETASTRDQKVILPIILLIVLVVLVLLLRSILAPILLILSVIATFTASFGASWLLFENLYGFPGLDVTVPLLAFLFLVALGVDYNIFLVTRAREEATRYGTVMGMQAALRATGGVITSAGILLAAVFAVLGVLPIITLTQIGIIVGIGVLLDTLLVRTVLVPALAFSLKEKFWWPNKSIKR